MSRRPPHDGSSGAPPAAGPRVPPAPSRTGAARAGCRRRTALTFLLGFVAGAAAIVVAAYVIDVTTLADWLVKPLQRTDTGGAADAIVVLGGSYWEPCGLTRATLQRTNEGVRQWQAGRAPLLVFTGGPTRESRGVPAAERMAELAVHLGVPREAILTEDESRTTHENAQLTERTLRPLGIRRILLVTDSIHMRRAEGSFRSVGFEIERASVPQVCVSPSNLAMLQSAIHEYGGLFYYHRNGWLLDP